jgi:competence protein ComEC
LVAVAGMQITLGDNLILEVLHPSAESMIYTSSDITDNSVVLRLEYGCFSTLLTGDVQRQAEELLLASGQALNSLALKVPHHGPYA